VRALAHIEANLDRPVSLAELAKKAAVGRKHFSVLFRRQTGWLLFDYVRARRLSHAAVLLRDATVEEVARALGMNVRTLERACARICGISPAALRDATPNDLTSALAPDAARTAAALAARVTQD
jgi:transcriptional regulator GlxA family with amidase domain